MKNIIKIIILVVVVFTILWLLPVKKTINSSNFVINKFTIDNKVTILCNSVNSTDVEFVVLESAGIKNCPKYIKRLTGSVSNHFLKKQIDDNYDGTKFLFIGNFNEEIKSMDESYSFDVIEWHTVGKINRTSNIMPYPSYGFNVFEIQF